MKRGKRNEKRVVKGKVRPWSKKIKNESIGWVDKPTDFRDILVGKKNRERKSVLLLRIVSVFLVLRHKRSLSLFCFELKCI